MLYDSIHNWLGWPDPQQTFEPAGAGAKAFAEFAQKKIQGSLNLVHPGAEAKIGVIAADSNSDSSEAPLALVCEFPRATNDEVLDLVHKLAWNLSRTALLVTLEPHRLIAWSCYQDPTQGPKRRVCELPEVENFKPTGTSNQHDVRDLLHWVNLITNRVQQEHPSQFPTNGRADALLLKNLRYVRSELLKLKLPQDHCHDLLARIIFTQFLFHRKDTDGNAFFSVAKMRRLQEDGVLSRVHTDLGSLLTNKTDIYSLFRWMDERFNGDLFPGKEGENAASRERAWNIEKSAVTKDHLDLLANLVSGNIDAKDKQQTLWPHYSFDTIPLEFISSVYEEFLTTDERGNDKAYYTPSYLVDFVLDAVLPWSGSDWNVRVLDPCCGSGIFLVKAFQRLIYRWRNANSGKEPLVRDLRPILENNLVGVDKNPEAVRVACFSLYLAMADAIEPKHYITRENIKVFPRLRGTRLIRQDFFDEDTNEIRTDADRGKFDYVLGNAPWGDGSIKANPFPGEERKHYAKRVFDITATKNTATRAQIWAKAKGWPVANNDIGPLFLAKAAALTKPGGFVAMVNTASLLYWRDGQAMELRKKLFTSFTFEEITNLSALRRELFTEAIGPSCIVVFRNEEPEEQKTLHYFTPKPSRSMRPERRQFSTGLGFSIEPYDIALISHAEAHKAPWVWSALAIGGNRHLALAQRLSTYSTIQKLEAAGKVETRKGVITGDKRLHFPEQEGKPILAAPSFPKNVFLELDASILPAWSDARATSGDSTDFSPFKSPQLLIKQSYVASLNRMRAVLVKKSPMSEETICREAYVTCHDLSKDRRHIRAACMAYNSKFAVFFFALTSGSFPLYISKMSVGELLQLPLPHDIPDISALHSFDAIDEATRSAFGFTIADWTLIDDFLDYTLPDILRKTPGKARFPVRREDATGSREPELTDYAKTFLRVVKGTFGQSRAVAATIYTDPENRKLPVRMLTIGLDAAESNDVSYETIEADGLLDKLAEFHTLHLKQKPRNVIGSGLGFQRVAYFFHPSRRNGKRVMNLTIVKPDELRYWTRSMAMNDADKLAASIMKAAEPLQKS